jgi:hypothetical protein
MKAFERDTLQNIFKRWKNILQHFLPDKNNSMSDGVSWLIKYTLTLSLGWVLWGSVVRYIFFQIHDLR